LNLIQQPFAVDHTDVLATQELLAHPVFGPLLWKILLIKEQEVLDEITAIAETSGKLAGFDKDHQLTLFAGYRKALKEFWPSLQALSQRDIAKEQAAAEKQKARRSRRKQ